eukprot:SAG31_NODE_6708_length_1916_cov_4.214089_1_plen_181_part_00
MRVSVCFSFSFSLSVSFSHTRSSAADLRAGHASEVRRLPGQMSELLAASRHPVSVLTFSPHLCTTWFHSLDSSVLGVQFNRPRWCGSCAKTWGTARLRHPMGLPSVRLQLEELRQVVALGLPHAQMMEIVFLRSYLSIAAVAEESSGFCNIMMFMIVHAGVAEVVTFKRDFNECIQFVPS